MHPRIHSLRFAFQGIKDLVQNQPNARIHIIAAVIVLLSGWFLELNRWEWIALIFCIAMVFAAEAFNTALEYLTDLVSPHHHPLAGKAKDAAASAVLITAAAAVAVGLILFLPKIFALL